MHLRCVLHSATQTLALEVEPPALTVQACNMRKATGWKPRVVLWQGQNVSLWMQQQSLQHVAIR